MSVWCGAGGEGQLESEGEAAIVSDFYKRNVILTSSKTTYTVSTV